jgi:hypothetical protein
MKLLKGNLSILKNVMMTTPQEMVIFEILFVGLPSLILKDLKASFETFNF